jgi:branched-chain amino acid transport system ATP-binding protein
LEKRNKILRIENIQTYYGVSHVIQGLSMYIEKQEAISILGRNGVGKTTTLRSIMGLTPARSGSIHIGDTEVTRYPSHKISKMGVAYVPAERHIFPGLSVEENLRLAARPGNGKDEWTLERVCDHFPVLADRTNQDGSTLSGGEQQMLAIGRALISNPKIIIMDEPSQGLSPLLVQTITDMVLEFCVKSGITMLIVEQNYRMALNIASRHYLMDTKGKVVKIATTQELVDEPEIIQSHLSV